MLEIVIGILSGIISAIGMGGGTILILLLVYTMQIEQHVAQARNYTDFSSFLCNANRATCCTSKQSNIFYTNCNYSNNNK